MLNKGDHVPRFEITTVDDVRVNYADVWQKKNLALVCLSEDDSPDAQSYIQQLREALPGPGRPRRGRRGHDHADRRDAASGMCGCRSVGRDAVDHVGGSCRRAPVRARDRGVAALRRNSVPGM